MVGQQLDGLFAAFDGIIELLQNECLALLRIQRVHGGSLVRHRRAQRAQLAALLDRTAKVARVKLTPGVLQVPRDDRCLRRALRLAT